MLLKNIWQFSCLKGKVWLICKVVLCEILNLSIMPDKGDVFYKEFAIEGRDGEQIWIFLLSD